MGSNSFHPQYQYRDDLVNSPGFPEAPQRQELPLSEGSFVPEVHIHPPLVAQQYLPQSGTSDRQQYQSNEPHNTHQPNISSKPVDVYAKSAGDPWNPYNTFHVDTAPPPRPQTRGPYSPEKKAKINHLKKNGGACSRCRKQKREASERTVSG